MTARRARLLVFLAVVAPLAGPAPAQDVQFGGRLDAELDVGRVTRATLGRDAGVDVTFTKPGRLDAYFDYSFAGGRGRLQEFYVRLPQTRPIAEVTVGRFLLPFGDPGTRYTDRYVAGGRDLFTSYAGWRHGNVLLDTDVTGLRLAPRLGPVGFDLVGAESPGGRVAFCGRVVGSGAGLRGGVSCYLGRDGGGRPLSDLALHGGYEGHGWQADGNGFLGRGAGGPLRGYEWRAGYRPPKSPFDGFAGQTVYHDRAQSCVTTWRVGGRFAFEQFYHLELRYERNNVAGAGGEDLGVLRLLAVF
jgi:hypothetical protein